MVTLWITPAEIAVHELVVEGDRYRHLFRARRMAVGDRVRLVDGEGRARWGEVLRVERRHGVVRLGDPAALHEPARGVELVVAPPKPQRAAWLMEKTTELGVAAVRFLGSERAPRRYGDGTLSRLRRVAIAALEQCQGSRLPEITGVHDWSELSSLIAGRESRYVLRPGHRSLASLDCSRRATVLVGPEGGWTSSELDEMQALDLPSFSLGPRILRVETAAVAAAAILLTDS